MKNPFLKYLFTCKNCGKESPCQLSAHSKKRLVEIHGKAEVNQRCWKCGYDTTYHLDRLYAKMQWWPTVVLWLVAIASSYFWGMSLYEQFGGLGGRSFDKKIEAITIAFILPLAVAGFVVVQMWRMDNRFNRPMRDQR